MKVYQQREKSIDVDDELFNALCVIKDYCSHCGICNGCVLKELRVCEEDVVPTEWITDADK